MTQTTEKDEELVGALAAAAFLKVHPNTLQRWRDDGTGPPFRRHGRKVLYLMGDLRAWSAARIET